jgi:carboxypeptidase family protein
MESSMKVLTRLPFSCAIAVAWLLLASGSGIAQTVTTGTLSGTVVDQQNATLPGASVVAVHEPTGTKYETTTGADGEYRILNVRVGGPYTVTAALNGFRTLKREMVNVALGEDRSVTFKLPIEAVTETVNVTASSVFDATRAGTAANVPEEAIEALPTIQRGLFDFARTSPYFSVSPDSANNDAFLSVAGRNPRYNSIQIDGAVNNDVFGISATGTPGAQTGAQPISLDAIQELQLVVAPYDVRQGGFTGGGINAVTKSGTNRFSGTAFYFGRNQGMTRSIPGLSTPTNTDPANIALEDFKDQQTGFSVGGPIVQNKAFFFGNLDFARKELPTGFSGDGSGGQAFGGIVNGVPGHQADLEQIANIMRTTYGFDPGSISEVVTPIDSDKVFFRTDFNLSPKHQLTARVNYINGSRQTTSSGVPSTTNYAFSSNYYTANEKVWSPVVQLNSTFGRAYNELRVAYTYDRFERVLPDPIFPFVRVDFSDLTNVRLGSENSSHANQLDQDIVELTDDVTFVKGKHTITVGTHNEFLHFNNVFIQNLYGQYEFSATTTAGAIQKLQDGFAQLYSRNFSNTSDPRQAAKFSVLQFGVYAGDLWRVAPSFTLSYGVRLDIPHFPDTPSANPLVEADFGYRTDIVPSPLMWSPRVGFNWDLSGGSDNRSQIRGGIGYFTGRTPYVWMSNQYGNTGVDFTNLNTGGVNNNSNIAFVADPFAQPTTVVGGQSGLQSVNLVDPDYRYPAVVRGNLAYDRSLGIWGLIATGELLYTLNVDEIAYQNINYIPVGQLDKNGATGVSAATPAVLPDGRINFHKYDTTLNDVLLLTNTSKGESWTASIKVDKPFRNGFSVSGSYLYNHATSINDGTASTAGSNWANNPIGLDVNNPAETRSNNDSGHRFNLTAVVPIPLGKGFDSTASFFFNAQSGRPYAILFNGNANGDNRTNNDLIFIPATPDQVLVQNGTWEQLDTFLSNDPASKNHRGEIATRNAGRAPGWNQLDFRYSVNLPQMGHSRIELTFDVFNLTNAFNRDWGWHYFPKFPSTSSNGLIGYNFDAATGMMRYNLATITSPGFQGTFDRDDQLSRAQAQFGARIRF